MTTRRTPPAASVLRGVALHANTHALTRPGSVPATAERASPEAPALSVEQAWADGHQQGYAAGQAAAARERDATLLAERQRAAEAGRRDGFEEGRALGLQQAVREFESEHAAALARLDDTRDRMRILLGQAAEQIDVRLKAAEEDMVALAHDMVCRVLGHAAASREALHAMLSELIAQRRSGIAFAAHVHPDDFSLLAAAGEERVRWVSDPDVKVGGIILRSADGSLDARLETQLHALAQALLRVRRTRSKEDGQ